MNTTLKLLVIEDHHADFLLLDRHLKNQGLVVDCRQVVSEAELAAALAAGGWDAVLSDYHVPGLDFPTVLRRIQRQYPDLPVIMVSGSMGEENAVELLKQGAWDFVLKDRLARLASVIERSLQDAAARRAQRQAAAELQDSRRAALNMMEDAVEARKRAEESMTASRASEEQFRAMFETAAIGMAQADPRSGCFLRVNPKMCALTGYSADELLTMRIRDITHPDDRASDRDAFQRVVGGEQPSYQIEKRYLRKDGTVTWVSVNMTVIRDAHGRPVRTMATIEDISDRKRAALALQESEARYHSVVDSVREVIFQTDAQGHWTLLNKAWEEITGFPVAASLGTLFLNYVHPEDRQRNQELFRPLIERQKEYCRHEIRYLTKSGGCRWIEVHARLTLDEHDQVTGTAGTLRDVTALRESEEQYRRLVDNAGEAIYVAREGIILFANRACALLTGYREAELIGQRSAGFAVPAEQARVAERQRRLAAGENLPGREEFRVRFRDGVERWISLSSVQIQWQNQPATLNFAYDISEHKRTEAALQLQGAALAAAANAIVITDAQGGIEWVNPAFTTLTGYTLEEARGKNPRDLIKSGQHDAAFYRALWQIILAGNVWHGEIINRRKDGTLFTEDMTITPLREAGGASTHFIAIKQDITERKNLEAHLLRTQRLESVGRLASGVAHDLNNILAPVLMAPTLLRDAIQDPAARSLVDTIEASAQRGANIIKQLLAFGRGLKGERVPLQFQTVVREMLKIIAETFPKNISTRTQMHAELPLVTGDATQLHQVLMNLSVNARDAMPAGGTLTFSLAPVTLDAAAAAALPDARAGCFVRLDVTDTGTGIPPENLEKIFDPFFTTKALGEGTGLGLSTVLGIVRSHGGFIEVQSTMGQGTTFRIYLPVTEAVQEAVAAEAQVPPPPGNGELVLLVDDEEGVRHMTRRMLEAHKYRVVEAQDGAEALSILTNLRQPIQALVTDLLMPRMDGLTLIRAIRQRNTRLPMVVMGGLPPSPDILREVGVSPQAFLAKPFSAAALLKVLQHVLA